MRDIIPLGKLIEGKADRDAIHIAILPVTAAEKLSPGQHVGVCQKVCEAGVSYDWIGIVDPYLTCQVSKGQRFYLMLYPNTISSLRHDWVLPGLGLEPEVELEDHERWLLDFAKKHDVGYQQLMDAAGDWGFDRPEYEAARDAIYEHDKEFCRHYEAFTGETIDFGDESCAC